MVVCQTVAGVLAAGVPVWPIRVGLWALGPGGLFIITGAVLWHSGTAPDELWQNLSRGDRHLIDGRVKQCIAPLPLMHFSQQVRIACAMAGGGKPTISERGLNYEFPHA